MADKTNSSDAVGQIQAGPHESAVSGLPSSPEHDSTERIQRMLAIASRLQSEPSPQSGASGVYDAFSWAPRGQLDANSGSNIQTTTQERSSGGKTFADQNMCPLVLEIGSGWSRIGWAGDETPCKIFPTVVGLPRRPDPGNPDSYVGDEAKSKRTMLNLKYPVEHGGAVTNWDLYEKILRHAVSNLHTEAQQHPVLLPVSSLLSDMCKEMMVQVLFECFQFPAVQLVSDAACAAAASGRSTALVLLMGETCCFAVPVIDGQHVSNAIVDFAKGGRDVTEYLMQLLSEQGYSFTTAADKEIVCDIKEKLCYCALDYQEQMDIAASSKSIEKQYELSDGRVVTMGNERFRAPEILFSPHFTGSESTGISEAVAGSIHKCDASVRSDLWSNIVLAGGCSLFPGFVERLQKELTALAPATSAVNIIAPSERGSSTWIGGSIVASILPVDRWISAEEYEQTGPAIVFQKPASSRAGPFDDNK